MVHENERIRQKIPELLQQLLVTHCERVDDAISPGLTMVSWLSMNLQSYLDHVNQELEKFELTVDRASGLIEHRIDATLRQITSLPLCELPLADTITTETFIAETQELCNSASAKLDNWNVMIERASHELITLLLPDDEMLLDAISQSNVINDPSQERPGTASYKRQLDQRTQLQQEAKQLVEYFNRQTIDALVTMTRRSLEVLRKRIATASHTYGEYVDDKKTSRQPLFSSNVLLSLPNVVMRPSLDDIQQAVNQGVQLIVGVTKEVYLWGQDRTEFENKETSSSLQCRSDPNRFVCEFSIYGNQCYCIMYRILRSGSIVVAINQKTLRSYHRVVSEHKEVIKLSSLLSSSINSTKRMVTMAMEQFYCHKYLWMDERNDVIGQFLAEERTVGDFQEQMQKYRNLSEMLNNEPDVVTVGPLSLHCGKNHHIGNQPSCHSNFTY